MRGLITLFLAMAVLAIVVLDGIGMYVAYQSAEDVAQAAAEQAVFEYKATQGNVAAAKAAAESLASSKGAELVDIEYHKGQVDWFSAEVEVLPDTYVFGHLPFVGDHLMQSSSAVAQF